MMERIKEAKEILTERLRLNGAYQRVFEGPDGELVLRHILKEGFATKTTFVPGDPQRTMLNEGSRRLAMAILRAAKGKNKHLIKQIEQTIDQDA